VVDFNHSTRSRLDPGQMLKSFNKEYTMTDVAKAVETMKAKFNPAAAGGLDLVFGFRIDEDKHFSLIVKDSTCELQEGENPDANVTLVMDSETLKGIVSGETDGMQAFMGGKLRAEGDMMLAMKLSELFPV
jgi:putative sterol carrier protein